MFFGLSSSANVRGDGSMVPPELRSRGGGDDVGAY